MEPEQCPGGTPEVTLDESLCWPVAKKSDHYFHSTQSENIKIFGPPRTKMFEIIGPPLKYFIPPTKFI